jgi:hypothetical protein
VCATCVRFRYVPTSGKKGRDSFAGSGDRRIRTDAPESDHVRATCTSCNLARHPIRRAESMTRFLVPRCRLGVLAFARRNVELYALPIGSGAQALGAVWSFVRSPERDEQAHGLVAVSFGFPSCAKDITDSSNVVPLSKIFHPKRSSSWGCSRMDDHCPYLHLTLARTLMRSAWG